MENLALVTRDLYVFLRKKHWRVSFSSGGTPEGGFPWTKRRFAGDILHAPRPIPERLVVMYQPKTAL